MRVHRQAISNPLACCQSLAQLSCAKDWQQPNNLLLISLSTLHQPMYIRLSKTVS